jgi:hypothetical protein
MKIYEVLATISFPFMFSSIDIERKLEKKVLRNTCGNKRLYPEPKVTSQISHFFPCI